MSGLDSIAVHAALSSTSQISRRIKTLQKVVGRGGYFADREALCNGLGEIAEAYVEGWENSSADDSDD